MKTRLSVIIASWNARSYLKNCISSVLETAKELHPEIVVVDNASTDGSPQMVAALFPHVKLVRNPTNEGFARANNTGMKISTGEYLALINSDILLHPGCLQQLINYLDRNPRIGLVGPRVLSEDKRLQRTCRLLPNPWNITCEALACDRFFPRVPHLSGREMRHWDHLTEAKVEVLSGCFWLARRASVLDVGPLDDRYFFYAEDIDWCKRFREAKWEIAFFPTACATHFGGASSANAPALYSIEMLHANLTYWRKHHGQFGRFSYYLLMLVHHTIRLFFSSLLLPIRRPAETVRFRFYLNNLRWLVTGRTPTASAAPLRKDSQQDLEATPT